jgi:phospholipid/cholesterol/gamma-HCH transport system substrate-binding protein
VVIAAGIALFCFAIFSIGGGSRLFARTRTIVARFHSINGLQSGAPVELSGVKVGTVESISFPSDPSDSRVIVRMRIDEPAARRIRTDSAAQIDSMGLLGDKFVELSPGTSAAPIAGPGATIPAVDPVDYQALLQKLGSGGVAGNLVAISSSMRTLLDQIEHGNGVMAELVRGQPGAAPELRLKLSTLEQTLNSVNRLSIQMDTVLNRINRGQGLAGAMFDRRTNGAEFLAEMRQTAASVRRTSARLDRVLDKFQTARGLIPQLMENRQAGDELMANMRASSRDLRDILHKIDTGQGTVGMAVNDPSLYLQLSGMLQDGGGWGLSLMRGLYHLTHPFAAPAPGAQEPVVMPARAAPR